MMDRQWFDTVTDWIGIPLAIALLVLLVMADGRFLAGKRPSRPLLVVVAVAMVAAVALTATRFAVLA